MTISRTVYNQLFEHSSDSVEHVIRLRPTEAKAGAVVVSAKNKIQMWTQEEHERFLVALEMFPAGPWKKVADYIGTKTPRQTMTHAQKYRQKISRRQRGLRNQKKTATSAPNSPKHPLHQHHHQVPPTIDTQSDFKLAPQPAQSPYGVADVYVKSEDKSQQADESSGRLDMLARAMQLQSDVKPAPFALQAQQQQQQATAADGSFLAPTQSVSPVPVSTSPSAPASPGNSSLPSLAQILNLRGSAQGAAAATRPGCSCSCSCSPSRKTPEGCQPSPSRQ